MSKLYVFLLLGVVAVSCNRNSGSKTSEIPYLSTSPEINEKAYTFQEYTDQFNELFLPYAIQEKDLVDIAKKAKSIRLKDAEKYICFDGNIYDCVVSPVDSETPDGIDIRKNFKVIGKVTSKAYILLVYLYEDEYGYHQAIATSYSAFGQPINSSIICGEASDSYSLDGIIETDGVLWEKTEYQYGHKYDSAKLVESKQSSLTIRPNGTFLDHSNK